MSDQPSPSLDATARMGTVTAEGRILIDSEALAQAVYLYDPIFSDGPGSEIVDLLILEMNLAARQLRLATHIREGARASSVFVDMYKALEAANAAWRSEGTVAYNIERHSFVGAQPIVVHYEVSTLRVGDRLVQIAVDHTTVAELESAETRFRLMAEAATDGLVLLAADPEVGAMLVGYANSAARQLVPALRVGEPAPRHLVPPQIDDWRKGAGAEPFFTVIEVDMPSRRASLELSFVDVGNDMVMLTLREITDEARARAALERSDRVLQAIGVGSFGGIAVYECSFTGSSLEQLTLAWSSESLVDGSAMGSAEVMSTSELVTMARGMLQAGEQRRHGWVVVGQRGSERTVEYALVHAGDRFVLEFVERTEELEAQTALAMVRAGAEAQRSFVSRISHELRSPLNVIHGYTQLLSQLTLPQHAAGHVEVVGRGVERMVQVVDDLLLLGQIDQGLLRIDSQAVPNDALVASILAGSARCQWWSSGALVPGHRTGDAASVLTDPARFTSLAMLVAEASTVVQRGIEVAPFARGVRAGVQFVVTGDSPVVDAVWRPFLHSHLIPGAGMGLSVARSMASLLKVSMELREDVDGQARVALVLLGQIAG